MKDRGKKASYLTASYAERALCVTLWFIISKDFLSKFTGAQDGCREHGNDNSRDAARSCLYRNGAARQLEHGLSAGTEAPGGQISCELLPWMYLPKGCICCQVVHVRAAKKKKGGV